MKQILCSLLIYCLAFSASSDTPIKGEDLFTNTTNSYMQLSPSGHLLSFLDVSDTERYLTFFDTVKDELRASIRLGLRSRLLNYYWLNDDIVLMDIYRDGRYSLVVARIDGRDVELIVMDSYGKLISVMPSEPDKILFSYDPKRGDNELFVVSIDDFLKEDFDNTDEIDFGVRKITGYSYESNAKRLLLRKYDHEEKTLSYYYQYIDSDDAVHILTLKSFEDYFEIVHFIDDNRLAVLTNSQNDKIVLQEFHINTGEFGEVIFSHPNYDLDSAAYNESGELVYVGYFEHGIFERTFFKSNVSSFAERLKLTFPDQGVFVTDVSVPGKNMILNVSGATEPGTYYLYSGEKDRARTLVSRHPQLVDTHLYPTEKFLVQVEDDVEIEAYLTRPNEDRISTLLVYPHGGPIGPREKDTFNRNVQYFASRGFAVLRVNFRGSGGFGKAFQKRGVGEFGKLIEQDIMKTVNTVLREHKFDNICAIGASYGGYSSAMLAIQHPELFKCVIAAFGVFDLPLMYNQSNVQLHEDNIQRVTNAIGEYTDELKTVSPVYLASRLKAPILIIAGKRDDIASFEHSNRLKHVLNKLGHPVETMFYENTGHGHANWEYEHHEAAITYDFLNRTLKLPPPELDTLEQQQAIADDYLTIADGYEFEDNVPDDKDKAFEYLQKAAEYQSPRAVFNMGAHYHEGDKVEKNLQKALEHYQRAGELEFEGAFLRLGTLYMQGYQVEKNWELAKEFLTKAVEKENEPRERSRLGRFYCLAPPPLQDTDKCLAYINMKGYLERSDSARLRAHKQLNLNLGWIFSEGNYSKEQLQELQEFTKNEYGLTHVESEMYSIDDGVFHLIEGEEFLEKDEYEYQKNANTDRIIPGPKTRVGARFELDVHGFDSRFDRTAIVVRWFRKTADEPKRPIANKLHFGLPSRKWTTMLDVSEYEEDSELTLEIYNLNQEMMFSNSYKVKGKGKRKE